MNTKTGESRVLTDRCKSTRIPEYRDTSPGTLVAQIGNPTPPAFNPSRRSGQFWRLRRETTIQVLTRELEHGF